MVGRVICALALAVLASSCTAEAPSPLEREAASVEASEQGKINLGGSGLTVSGTEYIFSTERARLETALTGILGEPESRLTNQECGAGEMQFTVFNGGFTVNFQNDRFVGWFTDEANDLVVTEAGIGVGADSAAATSAAGYAKVDGSTLGEEFALGERMGGFMENDRVSGLYAGTNCFFR